MELRGQENQLIPIYNITAWSYVHFAEQNELYIWHRTTRLPLDNDERYLQNEPKVNLRYGTKPELRITSTISDEFR